MNGGNLVADTSLLINFFNGSELAREVNENDIWISGITEIEVLASKKISPSERRLIKEFIAQIIVIDLTSSVKNLAIGLRTDYAIKLPDAIIAATALYLGFPLCSYDKGFDKVRNLDCILLKS